MRPPRGDLITDPRAEDPRLRGRTYAIPFDRVWTVAVRLAGGGLRGWTLMEADDQVGVLEAQIPTWPRRRIDRVEVRIGLDANAQTRVDLGCQRLEGGPRQRRHPRLVDSFLRGLDRALGAGPSEILDPTRVPGWLEPTRDG